MKQLGGKILFLDKNDINTDEIIPAKYLNEDSKKALGPFCFEDLVAPGFDRVRDLPGKGVIVSRANFGCGSSREHAPWALEANGIRVVIAESFARIFRRNMYNCGMLAAELPSQTVAQLFNRFTGQDTELRVDLDSMVLRFESKESGALEAPLSLGGFELAMLRSSGWLDYAAARY
ncbi:MAG: 3-isopropylmalate dehydratase small subunit [Spirochaetia bacterium]|jgi:3-isopropylmalate/(R)-2-methylmalate dehydratase small subunit|nr:3-isopropylmalate dehydratase small subunit [Spirochaetia bacterium]